MIKAVIFDVGHVLIHDPRVDMLAYCSEKLHVARNIFTTILSRYDTDWTKGKLTEKEFWEKMTTDLGVAMPKEKSLWLESFLRAYKEKEDVFSLVKKLKKHNIKTALLSNTEIPIMNFLRAQWKEFDVSVYSCEVGMMKPDAEIYQYALKELHLKPEEVIFIDDKQSNVDGAKAVGMHGIIFFSSDSLQKQLHDFGLTL